MTAPVHRVPPHSAASVCLVFICLSHGSPAVKQRRCKNPGSFFGRPPAKFRVHQLHLTEPVKIISRRPSPAAESARGASSRRTTLFRPPCHGYGHWFGEQAGSVRPRDLGSTPRRSPARIRSPPPERRNGSCLCAPVTSTDGFELHRSRPSRKTLDVRVNRRDGRHRPEVSATESHLAVSRIRAVRSFARWKDAFFNKQSPYRNAVRAVDGENVDGDAADVCLAAQ